jgi:hypothetical protein
MHISRRGVIRSLSAGLVSHGMPFLTKGAWGQDLEIPIEGMEQFEPLPDGFSDGISSNETSDVNFGSINPPAPYRSIAGAIMRGAPVNCRPIDVAYYFVNLRAGRIDPAVKAEIDAIADQVGDPDLKSELFLRLFAYDWERNNYYNPVVVSFFRGVGLVPYAGDQTPWCATFANWCISRSKARSKGEVIFSRTLRSFGTRSASSGSFRCWGEDATASPKEGDIIVWARNSSLGAHCPTSGQGHVAFLHSVVTDPAGVKRFVVVGGNQGFIGKPRQQGTQGSVRAKDVAQAVSRRTIGRTFGDRSLHSIRTANFLRV